MPEIVRDGVRIHFEDIGRGPPVLLLHAFPLSAASFEPQVSALSTRYRFILPDHRGFGRSDVGHGPCEMSTLASDALAVMDALGLTSAVVGGVSMGGYASLALLRADPSRVQALVLVDTQGQSDDEQGKLKREQTARALEDAGTEVLIESLLPKMLSTHAPEALRNRLADEIRQTSAQGAANAQRGMAGRADARDVLSRYAGPSLVVVGELDALTPPAKARIMANLLQGSRLVTIPQAGHLAHLEAPVPFNRALDDFLQSLGSADV